MSLDEQSKEQLLLLIKKLEAEQVPMKAQLAEIDKERDSISSKIWSIEEEIRATKQSIKDIDAKADELVRIERYKGVDPKSIKVEDLDHIPLDMVHQLVKLIYKEDVYTFREAGMSEHCRIRYYHLTGLAYRDGIIKEIWYSVTRREIHPCRFCHCLFHEKKDCPILLKKKCKACGKHGHSLSHCTVTIKDLISTKRVTLAKEET